MASALDLNDFHLILIALSKTIEKFKIVGAVSDLLKVSKFQKQIFLFSFEPKTNEIIFLILP